MAARLAMLRAVFAAACLLTAASALATSAAAPLTQADAEAWLDGMIPTALRTQDLAGAVVVIVKDGELLLAKGYGHADIGAGVPVDPQRTLFRPGSVSKLVTWTAVMQLVERGAADLDADINTYLDFRIPDRDGQPITLRHLLTHSAGFEEMGKHLFSRSVDTLPSLEVFIKDWVPTRVYPAGEIPAYSNYGASLAGYLVQRISGQSFDDYVEQHIFTPLGMHDATFRQPLPERLKPQMARSYRKASEPPVAFELVGPAPAGAMSVTGADMARFMIAHLQDGRFGDVRILQEETARQMHATAMQGVPPLNGMALGFYREDRNGEVIVAHGGDTRAFHSNLHLVLSRDVGLFVSISGAGNVSGATSTLRRVLFDGFMDRYFPVEIPTASPLPTARKHGEQLAGWYRASRGSRTNYLASLGVINQFHVEVAEDGTLQTNFHRDLSGQPRRWQEIEPWVWQEIGGHHRLAAVVENGRVVRVGSDDFPPIAVGLPVPWWLSAGWNRPLLFVTVGILVLAVLSWPVTALYRWAWRLPPAAPREARWLRLAVAMPVLFWGGWALVFMQLLKSPTALDGGLDPWIRVVQCIGVLVIPATLHVVVRALRGGWAWRSVLARWPLALACVATLWFAFSLKLITPSLNY